MDYSDEWGVADDGLEKRAGESPTVEGVSRWVVVVVVDLQTISRVNPQVSCGWVRVAISQGHIAGVTQVNCYK